MHKPTVILMSLLAFFILLATVLITYIAARPTNSDTQTYMGGTGGSYRYHHTYRHYSH